MTTLYNRAAHFFRHVSTRDTTKRRTVYQIFPELIHPIRYPEGETEESVFNYLNGFRLDGYVGNELESYLREDFRRFVYTLNLLPENQVGSFLLEIGANPYFTSILIRKFTKYRMSYSNYFGNSGTARQIQRNEDTNDVFEFEFANHNIDTDDIPFEDKFDVILFCEVLEHLTNDPMQALLRIKKALKGNGILILTTPNVSRLENISKMLSGFNIYDPYSGHGIYGRHNREYNRHEIFLLLTHLGFEIEKMFTSDVHDNHSDHFFPVERYVKNILDVEHRKFDLGQYIFVRARNAFPAKSCKPRWLLRSYPEQEFCEEGV